MAQFQIDLRLARRRIVEDFNSGKLKVTLEFFNGVIEGLKLADSIIDEQEEFILKLDEALKVCIDGKRITLEDNEDVFYVYWDSRKFIFHNLDNGFEEEAFDIFNESDGWVIYAPLLNFPEAVKYLFNGGTIISSSSGVSYNLSDESVLINKKEMMGSWGVK